MSSAELAALVELLSEAEWAAAARRCLALDEGAALAVQVEPAQGDAGEGGGDAEGDPQVAGFVGETLPVRVTVRQGHGDGGEAHVLHMFLKVVPRENAARARLALSSRAFVKEAGLYGRAFPLMEAALARGRGRGWRWRPRCFVAREDLLLMEDLRHLGFRPLGNRQVLEEAHCATALEALAALHAASLALEAAEGAPPLGERFREHVQENMFTDAFPSYMNHFITSAMPGVKHLVGLVPAYRRSPRYQEILRKIDQLPRKAYAMVKASGQFRNVVCHGDLWVGNVLFRYDAGGSAEEARLVDFQQARYCPPALDVMSFLHLSTRRAFRAERGASLRSLYHRALVRELPAAERLLPREALEASCARYAAFARIIAACYLPADLLPRAVLRRLVCTEGDYERYLTQDRSAHYERQWRSDAAYRAAVQEVVEELVDGLLLNPDAWDAWDAWDAADQTDGAC